MEFVPLPPKAEEIPIFECTDCHLFAYPTIDLAAYTAIALLMSEADWKTLVDRYVTMQDDSTIPAF
jgi:hypothetical protein